MDKPKNGLYFNLQEKNSDINVGTENPEFSEWKWINHDTLIDNAVPFKRDLYQKVLEEFKNIF